MAVYEKAIQTYSELMMIEDVQVKDDIVQVFLADMQGRSKEDVRILVTMDDYFNEGLRKGMRISGSMIETLKKREEAVRAWQSCMRKVAVRDRTRKEMYDWLTRNTSCDIETINDIVDRLEEKGYIDDERYCSENISRMKLKLLGEERIVRSLQKKGIPADMVRRHLDGGSDDEFETAAAYAKKPPHPFMTAA
jgi:1,2-diacylglycerol 3-alpha-glucosyltransferase